MVYWYKRQENRTSGSESLWRWRMADQEVSEDAREAARLEMQFALQLRDTMISEGLTAARWSQSSLLVINGGAAVASMGLTEIGSGRIISGAAFVLGMLLALLAAGLGARQMMASLKGVSEMAGYWLGVAHDGTRVPEIEQEHQKFGAEMVRKSMPAKIVAYASAICFAFGCAAIGFSLE